MSPTKASFDEASAPIGQLLDRWTARGYITKEQAERIRKEEGQEAKPPAALVTGGSHGSLIAEGLGYLGGVLIVVAASLITFQYWPDIPTAGRLALPASAAALLLAAGWVVDRQRSTLTDRLRAVLWLGSTAAMGFVLWVVGDHVLGWAEDDLALLVGIGTAVFAAALWALHRTFVQQLALFSALVITVISAAAHLDGRQPAPAGIAVWGLGIIWLALAWGGLLHPRRADYVLGTATTLVGATITMAAGDWGYVFALTTVVVLVILAVVLSDLVMLGVAALGALVVLPASVTHFFPGALAAPLALLTSGLLLVLAALRTTRRVRRRLRRAASRRDTDKPTAIAIACGAAVVATLAALLIGTT